MAFCAFYGSLSPDEYADMEPSDILGFVDELRKIVDAEHELQVNIGKMGVGAKLGVTGQGA